MNGIGKLLHEFGVSPEVAEQLAQMYPQEHVLFALEFTRHLVEIRSPLANRNPAGFLIRAIQGAYPAAPGYKTTAQREADEQHQAAAREADAAQIREVEQAYTHARAQAQQRLHAQYPPRPIPDTTLTTTGAWAQTLADMREQVTDPIFQLWCKPTELVSCDRTMAVIAATSSYQVEQLEQRQLGALLEHTLSRIIGHRVGCRFVTVTEVLGETTASATADTPTTGAKPSASSPTEAAAEHAARRAPS